MKKTSAKQNLLRTLICIGLPLLMALRLYAQTNDITITSAVYEGEDYCIITSGSGQEPVADPENPCPDIENAKEEALQNSTQTRGDCNVNPQACIDFYMVPFPTAEAWFNYVTWHIEMDTTGAGTKGGYYEAFTGYGEGCGQGNYDQNWTKARIPVGNNAQSAINMTIMPSYPPCGVNPGGCNGYIVDVEKKLIVQNCDTLVTKPDSEAEVGDPISAIDGNVVIDEQGFSVATPGLPLEASFEYNSIHDMGGCGLGPKWSHNYNLFIYRTNSVFDGYTNEWAGVFGGGAHVWLTYEINSNCCATWVEATEHIAYYPTWYVDGSAEIRITGGITYFFNGDGVLTNITDGSGNLLALGYSNSNLVQVQHSNGQSLEYSYLSNRLVRIDSPSTNLYLLFSYNELQELTNIIKVAGDRILSTSYLYDTNGVHCITQRVNAAGDKVNWIYATNETGLTTTMGIGTYFTTNEYLRMDFDFTTTNYNYTTTLASKENSTNRYEYHYHPFLKKLTGIYGPNQPNPLFWKGTRYELDSHGNKTNLEYANWAPGIREYAKVDIKYEPEGQYYTNIAYGYMSEPTNNWGLAWNASCMLINSVTDPEGNRTALDYSGGLIGAIHRYYDSSNSYDTTLSYSNGLLVSVTNANGHWIRASYDSLGHLSQITPQAGPWISIQNSALGHPEAITMPGEAGDRTFGLCPNDLGWYTNIVFPDTTEVSISYDNLGNATSIVDRAGRETRYSYLPGSKLAGVTRILEGATNTDISVTYEYDKQFNTLNIVDELGRSVEYYELDEEDRPVTVSNVESQEMQIVYGLGHHVRQITRFDGSVVALDYNEQSLLSQQAFEGQTNTYTYFKNGLLKSAANSVGVITNTYDSLNRLVASKGASPTGTVSYAYYPAGQISNVVYMGETITYGYDEGERVTTSAGPEGSFEFTYNTNNGMVAEVSCANGLAARYGYDIMDQLTNIVWANSSGTVVRSMAYAYNSAGMITAVKCESGASTEYGYDSLDRLTSETLRDAGGAVVSESTYAYDYAGNRTQKTRDGTTVEYALGSGNRLSSWAAAPAVPWLAVQGYSSEPIGTDDRYGELWVSNFVAETPSVSGTNFWIENFAAQSGTQQVVAAIRDAAGNMGYATNTIFLNVVTNGFYGYNAAGCVTSILYQGAENLSLNLNWNSQYQLTAVSTNGVECERNGYDALGRKVWSWDGTATNYFVYDGVHVLAEVDSTGGLRKTYTHGPGVDNWLAMTVYTGATAKTYFYITDHQGTVHAVADETGAVVESYRFDSWGRVLGVYDGNGTFLAESAIGNRILWQGREYSWKTGLYYFRARWYDPVSGRWLSNDPIGISGGLNQYVFCANNPVNSRDPLGLVAWADAGRAFAGMIGNGLGAVGGGVLAVGTGGAGAVLGGVIVFKSSYGFGVNAENFVAAMLDKPLPSTGAFINDVVELAVPGNANAQRLATATDLAIDLAGLRFSSLAKTPSLVDRYGNVILEGGAGLGPTFFGSADEYLNALGGISALDALGQQATEPCK